MCDEMVHLFSGIYTKKHTCLPGMWSCTTYCTYSSTFQHPWWIQSSTYRYTIMNYFKKETKIQKKKFIICCWFFSHRNQVKLLILDSITYPLRTNVDIKLRNNILAFVGQNLAQLASRHKLAVCFSQLFVKYYLLFKLMRQ